MFVVRILKTKLYSVRYIESEPYRSSRYIILSHNIKVPFVKESILLIVIIIFLTNDKIKHMKQRKYPAPYLIKVLKSSSKCKRCEN